MTDAPRFEIERTPEGGAAVYIVQPVWAATFASEPEARAYVAWRESRDAGLDEDAAEDERAADAVDRMLARDELATCLICGIDVAAPCTSTASAAACAHYAEHGDVLGAAEPDANPEPEDLPEDDDAALAALAAMEAPEPAPAPTVEITLIPDAADPTGGDPYHEAGEAFRRLKAGEQLGTVADDLGLPMPKLRSRWARYQQALQVAGWQPGATVAKPAEPPLDDDWCTCARCKTRFNAVKAQAAAKLPQRPTLCAVCRGR